MEKDYWYWAHWQRGCGFDIANTNCLNRAEKIILLKGMNEIVDSQGERRWTGEEIALLRRIKDYNHHIGDWSNL